MLDPIDPLPPANLADAIQTFYNTYAICAFAAIGGGLFGFDISSMSGVLGTNGYKNYFGNRKSVLHWSIHSTH